MTMSLFGSFEPGTDSLVVSTHVLRITDAPATLEVYSGVQYYIAAV